MMQNQLQFKHSQCLKTGNRQRGVGIVEVLVALVVVSFGVLGMASLQLTGMKHSTGGFNRAKALMFAENMATRMRINEAGVDKSHYGNFDSEDAAFACSTTPKLCQAIPSNLDPPMCNSQEFAAFDLYTLACGDINNAGNPVDGVQLALASGRIQVDCDVRDGTGNCIPNSTHTITVTWQEGSVASEDKTDVLNRRVQVRLQP